MYIMVKRASATRWAAGPRDSNEVGMPEQYTFITRLYIRVNNDIISEQCCYSYLLELS
jgi:hypothetical protein